MDHFQPFCKLRHMQFYTLERLFRITKLLLEFVNVSERTLFEIPLYFHWKPVKFNIQWLLRWLRQCSACLCALGGSRDSQQEKWLPTQHFYILFPSMIHGLHSNDVFFYGGLAPQSVLLCFGAVCLWLISTDRVVVVVPHPINHPQT